ncbi:Parathyroid hormone/parathyroid hormone-related peptide receptor [Sarcoptes scabiei]|uniref:Parathyroid hormone/parathyroid hormone-related peptide receptor n=1 Tax=Sarcoptes scabiei TaxID=52283 RepID=A0A834RF95_SARSC|nr:Parathyroid hormone/parathyroid hormone-related peptide receptor [Sarcoptes scabiei]
MRKRERERGEGKMPSNRIVKMFSIDLNLFLSILILLGKISTPSKSITIIEINSTADVIESIDNIFINTDDHIDGDDGGDIGNKSANNSIGDDFDEIDPLISSRRPQQLQLSIDWKQKNLHHHHSHQSRQYRRSYDISNQAEQLLALDRERKRCLKVMKSSESIDIEPQFDTIDQGSVDDGLKNRIKSESHKIATNYCQSVWDGALCWPKSLPNKRIDQPCPSYVKGFNHRARAYKFCTEKGIWFYNNQTKRFWTDYSECIGDRKDNDHSFDHLNNHHNHTRNQSNAGVRSDKFDEKQRINNVFDATINNGAGDDHHHHHHQEIENDSFSNKLIKFRRHIPNFQLISHLGYSISFLSLVIAFLVLVYVKFFCRRLRCPRNSLHLQLFVSFIIRSSMYLIKTSTEHLPLEKLTFGRAAKSLSKDATEQYSTNTITASNDLLTISANFDNEMLGSNDWALTIQTSVRQTLVFNQRREKKSFFFFECYLVFFHSSS